jgi:hypothetical protein
MTDTQRWARREGEIADGRKAASRAFDIYRALFQLYTGFVLGLLAHAGWTGDDLVFWPWSLAFLVMLTALVVWQRRRSGDAVSRAQDPEAP